MKISPKAKRVYVAGKLNAEAVDYLHNVHKMMTVAEETKRFGYSVFVPAIDLLMGIKFGYSNYHDYFDNNMSWLRVSEAILLVPGWLSSKGTQLEIETALTEGIPVFDSIHDLNEYFERGVDSLRIIGLTYNDADQVVGVVRRNNIIEE